MSATRRCARRPFEPPPFCNFCPRVCSRVQQFCFSSSLECSRCKPIAFRLRGMCDEQAANSIKRAPGGRAVGLKQKRLIWAVEHSRCKVRKADGRALGFDWIEATITRRPLPRLLVVSFVYFRSRHRFSTSTSARFVPPDSSKNVRFRSRRQIRLIPRPRLVARFQIEFPLCFAPK